MRIKRKNLPIKGLKCKLPEFTPGLHPRRIGNRTRLFVETSLAGYLEMREQTKAARTAFDEGILHRQTAQCARPSLGFQLFVKCKFFLHEFSQTAHMTICETIPATANAPTNVPIQITVPSFSPRSFIMTINEAMQGTNNVIVINATTICNGVSDI